MKASRWVPLLALLALAGCREGDGPTRGPEGGALAAVPTRPAQADPADWCGGHDLPESMCTLCNPELTDGFKAAGDWCAEHGLPESVCPKCNPLPPPAKAPARAAQAVPTRPAQADPADWCGPHRLPESMCALCNPTLIDGFKATGDWCAEHGLPESVCPDCNPLPPPPGARADAHGHAPGGGAGPFEPGTRIRFETPAIERAAGIETVPAERLSMDVGVSTTARVDFDRNRMADVRTPVPGIVRAVEVDLGERVEAGQPLFSLESAQIGDLQARRGAVRQRVSAARAELKRQRSLRESAIASARDVEVARQELEAAEAALRSIEDALRLGGAGEGGGAGGFVIGAPIAGTVVRRPALLGTHADETTSLATIADRSTMWALLDVPEWQVSAIRVGQPARIEVDGVPDQHFEGPITWIAAEVDPRTRTVTARAEVPDPDGVLRAGQFARATVRVAPPSAGATVPVAAVQHVGDAAVVFVRTGPGLFEPRAVRPGRADGRRVQVEGGVRPGEAVVTTGAFLLRTELTRESIGSGCCEVEGPGE